MIRISWMKNRSEESFANASNFGSEAATMLVNEMSLVICNGPYSAIQIALDESLEESWVVGGKLRQPE